MADPYWSDVVLAMPMDGANDSTTFTDLKGHTVTLYGNARIKTTALDFGGAAAYFDGSGDYATIAGGTDFNFGANPVTIEFFYTPISRGAYSSIINGDDPDYPFCVYHGTSVNGGNPLVAFGPSASAWFAGASGISLGPVTNGVRYHIAIVRDGDTFKVFKQGVKVGEGTTDSAGQAIGNIATITLGKNGAYYVSCYLDALRITKGVARYTDDFTPPATSYFDDVEGLVRVRAELSQSWGDAAIVASTLNQPWGIKLGIDLIQPWSDAPVIRAILSQPWGNASVLRAELRQRWESSFTLRATLEQGWNIYGVVLAELEQRWAITADLVRGVLEQGWDLRERDLLRAELLQRWAIEADGAALRYTVAVDVDGVAVGFSHLNIEGGLDQDVLSCELHLGSEGDYLRCRMGEEIAVSITSAAGTEAFVFVITAPRITEEHGNTQYIVEAMSPAVLLGEPYADPIEGELSGLASAIAATLSGSVPLSWQTVDWEIPPSTWIAAGETPLALLKTLAASVGAVVQSLADGSLVIMPEWPVSINQLGTVTPAVTLVENLDCWTTGSTPELKSGYNRFLIGDQLTTAKTLRLDEESISDTVKLVRGYQTPWTGEFELIHTGGDWVVIEPLGIEERQETETIEIVAGAGRVQYPIYSRDLVEWGQVNLGSVTISEDGSVQASVAEESLLTITYTTRCKKWQVRDPRNEQLQLVVPA